MEVSENTNPNFEKKKTSNALNAERTIHRVIFNPKKASPRETLRVPVPKFDDGVFLVPGSLSLIFDLKVNGHASNHLVSNVSKSWSCPCAWISFTHLSLES